MVKINNPDISSIPRHRYIAEAMIEDGRLTEDDLIEIGEEPTVDFLLECLTDKNYIVRIVRKEAIIALRRFKDKRAVDPLIQALKDKHWAVRKHAATTLGAMGDSKAIKPLSELIERELWHYFVRKEAELAIKKLKSDERVED